MKVIAGAIVAAALLLGVQLWTANGELVWLAQAMLFCG